jgi:23S rRNA pseudouridine2605 synthase
MAEIRLQKYLAEAGVASRRKSEELIQAGRVEVNGIKTVELGIKVSESDIIKVDGKEVKPEDKKVYIMLNKPAGYVTTSKDQFSRKTVMDLIQGVNERIYPVGRLDYETSGLLLLTNDGDLAYKLTHPKHEAEKVYHVKIAGFLDELDIERFKKGIKIDDYVTSPAKLRILEKLKNDTVVEITIHEGKNRQVRRMFEAVGYTVLKLKRVSTGPLKLEGLEEGSWRHLNEKEIKALVNMNQ